MKKHPVLGSSVECSCDIWSRSRPQDHLFYSCCCSLVTIYILLPTSSILIRNGLSSLWTGPIIFELFDILSYESVTHKLTRMEDAMKNGKAKTKDDGANPWHRRGIDAKKHRMQFLPACQAVVLFQMQLV